MKLTFVDLFAGIGMARMGMEQAGFKCVYTCEFDEHKRKEYEIIHGNIPEGCDIRDVRAADIPRSDVWFFGAPCQDFSIAGLRKGLGGDRSSLIGEVFRLIEEKAEDKPEWIIYENVKGMLSSNYGYDFLSILLTMDGLGYDIEWQTLNTKDFGIPQNRERVYTIGHLRTSGSKQILPITTDSKQIDKLEGKINSTTITARYGNAFSNGTYIIEGNERKQTSINQVASLDSDKRFNPNQYRVYDTDGLSPCLNTAQGGGREPHVLVKPKDRSCNQGVYIQDGEEYVIRKLTPKECMRLQGVPDEYTDKLIQAGISDSQIYKAAGDGLSVPIAKEIGERIKKLT
ncbi:DNA cytosine methyltransferase [Solobacterium moorei]|uniref:DNA cytosine methyltransferase n=1 Tax=Solobacterium moorei TaxID=102148 RepID=UPI0024AE2A63|nr:DNA cytosine methyltransferase [Solobacterium moorei]MDI6414430.1 DNA cytosine methyltransferase [Solobacterium moorei]QYC52389.1 putative cytosine specific methyltransferase [Solobacterium phage SMO_1P]